MKDLKNCPFCGEETNEMDNRTIETEKMQPVIPDPVMNRDEFKADHDHVLELLNSTNALL